MVSRAADVLSDPSPHGGSIMSTHAHTASSQLPPTPPPLSFARFLLNVVNLVNMLMFTGAASAPRWQQLLVTLSNSSSQGSSGLSLRAGT